MVSWLGRGLVNSLDPSPHFGALPPSPRYQQRLTVPSLPPPLCSLLYQAKTTKKIVLRLQCTVCKATCMHPIKRQGLSQTVPALRQTVPVFCQTIPALCQTVPAMGHSVPALSHSVPLQCRTVPALCQTVQHCAKPFPHFAKPFPLTSQVNLSLFSR
jgi:hypothetical protein